MRENVSTLTDVPAPMLSESEWCGQPPTMKVALIISRPPQLY